MKAASASCVTTDTALLGQVEAKTTDPWNGARTDLLDMFTRSHKTMLGEDNYTVAAIKARLDKQGAQWQGAGPNPLWQAVYRELDELEACRLSSPAAGAVTGGIERSTGNSSTGSGGILLQ